MEEAIDVDYLDLPNHILEKMFQDLPVEDLKNVMRLNSNYYDFVINSFNLSRKFKLVIKNVIKRLIVSTKPYLTVRECF